MTDTDTTRTGGTRAGGKRHWVRTLLINTALMIVAFAIAACTAEVAVRIVAPQQLIMLRPDLWQPEDTVGWSRRPNVDALVNTGEGTVHLITDQQGFRVGAAGRTAGAPVLLLGDSFMEALQVEYEESLAGLLEQSLSEGLGTPVSIRNAGVGGWGPGQYLARARSALPQDDYRLVIVAVYVGNDAPPVREEYFAPRQSAERMRFRVPDSLEAGEILNALLWPLNDALETRSHLFILVRNQLKTWRMRTGLTPLYFPAEYLKSEATSDRWMIAADICAEINELARANGARALFVLIPSDFQIDRRKFDQYVQGFSIDTATVDLDQPNRRLAEELHARNLDVVDVLDRFRELHAAGLHLHGVVDAHLSVDGHRAAAEVVTPRALELLSAQ